MLLGKMLRGLTGTPMRRIALANSSLALAEPDPFTLANLMTKSLTASMLFIVPPRLRPRPLHCPPRGPSRLGTARRRSCHDLLPPVATHRPGGRHLEQELLHVPGACRTALGAQAA